MAEQNIIEVVIKAVDGLSANVKTMEAQLRGLQGGMVGVQTSSKEAGQGLNVLNTVLTGLGVNIGLLGKSMSQVLSGMRLLKQSLPILGVGALVGGLAAMAKGVADSGIELLKMARTSGFTVETLSAFKVVAEANDESIQSFSFALRYFNRNLSEATRSTGEARDIFLDMGLSLKQIREGVKDPEKLFMQVISAIVGMTSAADQNRFAMRLFGRGASELIPIFKDLTGGIDEAKKKAQDLGLLWTGEMVNASKNFKDNINTISQNLQGLGITVAGPVLTAMNALLVVLGKIANIEMRDLSGKIIPKLKERRNELFMGRGSVAEEQARERGIIPEDVSASLAAAYGVGPTATLSKIPAAAQRQIEDFQRGLARQLKENQIRGTSEGTALEIMLGVNTLDETIKEFVRKFNESIPEEFHIDVSKFAKVRSQIIKSMVGVKMQEEFAKELKARAEAVLSRDFLEELPSDVLGEAEWKRRLEFSTKYLAITDASAAREKMIDEARSENLEKTLTLLRETEAPYSKILNVLRDIDALEKERLETQIKQTEERLKQLEIMGVEKLQDANAARVELEILKSKRGTVGTKELFEKISIKKQAEDMADSMASDFTERFIQLMEGKAGTLGEMFKNLGRTIVSQFLQGMLAQMLVDPLLKQLEEMTGKERREAGRGGLAGLLISSTKSLFGFGAEKGTKSLEEIAKADLAKLTEKIGSSAVSALDAAGAVADEIGAASTALAATGLDVAALSLNSAAVSLDAAAAALMSAAAALGGQSSDGGFSSLFGLFGSGLTPASIAANEYARGSILPGNFVPVGALRRFQTGGVAHGPTLGIIGEEGPEIVARMKPARPGDMGGGDIKQNIYLVDSRPPRLGPRDVVLYVAADMRAGGKTADAVQNVIKRT